MSQGNAAFSAHGALSKGTEVRIVRISYRAEALEKLLQQNPGGVTRLPVGLAYFTYDFEGDALIFSRDWDRKIKRKLL